MQKYLKPGRRYMIINVDEPYAKKVFEILKKGQQAKGEWPEGDITFEEWKKQTFYERETKKFQDVKEYGNVYVDGQLLIKVGSGYVDVAREKVVKEAEGLEKTTVDEIQDVEAAAILGEKPKDFRHHKRKLIDKYRNYDKLDADKLADDVMEKEPDVVVLTRAAFEQAQNEVENTINQKTEIKKFFNRPIVIIEGEEVTGQVGFWPEALKKDMDVPDQEEDDNNEE